MIVTDCKNMNKNICVKLVLIHVNKQSMTVMIQLLPADDINVTFSDENSVH